MVQSHKQLPNQKKTLNVMPVRFRCLWNRHEAKHVTL